MALRITKGEIPEGAVRISENEAAEYQWLQLKAAKNFGDVWPFRLGLPILGAAATFGSVIVNEHFRKKLKLRNYGFIATNLAVGLTPAVLAIGCHNFFILNDILLDQTKCILCIQNRAAAFHVGITVLYPLTIAPIAGAMYASRHGTYRLPYHTDYKELLTLWWKFVKDGRKRWFYLTVFQAFIAGFITFKEKISLLEFRLKMIQKEEDRARRREELETIQKNS